MRVVGGVSRRIAKTVGQEAPAPTRPIPAQQFYANIPRQNPYEMVNNNKSNDNNK
jgi:hypothetical protein